MSDTEVAEIEDMLNTSKTKHVGHLEILNPPQSNIIHRHELLTIPRPSPSPKSKPKIQNREMGIGPLGNHHTNPITHPTPPQNF